MSTQELRRFLASGHSVAEIAEKQGISLDEIVKALVEPIAEQIRQALQNERVSEEDAKKKIESVRQSFIRALRTFRIAGQRDKTSATVRPVKPTIAPARPRALPFNIRLVARALDTEVDELHKLIAQGHTIEEIADTKGVSLKQIAQGLVSSVERELKEAVESGRINEEDAKRRLESSRQAIIRSLEKFVTTNETSSRERDRTSTRPATDVRPIPSPNIAGSVLPNISSLADILGLLEVNPDTVRKLRGEGLSTTEIARRLGLGRAAMVERLMAIGKQRIRSALEQGTISAEEATKLIAHFEALVQKWVGEIFSAPVLSITRPSDGTAGRDTQGTRESNTSGATRDTTSSDASTSDSGTSTETGTNEDKETSSLGTTYR